MTTVNGDRDLRERSTGDLVRELSSQVSTLARMEVELAKAELAEKGKQAGAGAAMLGGAAVAALLALGSLTALAIMVLSIFLPEWGAALLVTAAWAAAAATLAVVGRDRLRAAGAPVPEETVESVKEDVQWLKGQKSSGVR